MNLCVFCARRIPQWWQHDRVCPACFLPRALAYLDQETPEQRRIRHREVEDAKRRSLN